MRGASLERFKFAVYLAVPVAAVYIFSLPIVHETVFARRPYIVLREDAHADVRAEAAAFRRKRAEAEAAATAAAAVVGEIAKR